MKRSYRRQLFLNTNRYQRKIIWPIFVACVIAGVMTFLSFDYYVSSLTQNALLQVLNYEVTYLEWVIPALLLGVAAVLLFIILWTFGMSNRIVGPFERIIKEADEVIAGKKKTPISARKGDEMFEQLLKRVNAVIERIK